MSKVITLKKGLDIKLLGEAEKRLVKLPLHASYGIYPDDFKGITPKLLVKEGATVKVGTPLIFDKNRPTITVSSPVSGTVTEIRRGAKRKLESIIIASDGEQACETFELPALESATPESIVTTLLTAGLWPMIVQRPYGVVADPTQTPKAIFISGFDSAPLAPDLNYVVESEGEALQMGLDVLAKLTSGGVHLGVNAKNSGKLTSLKGVETHLFQGAHPVGNVGVQIHHTNPINKGEVVWTINLQDVVIIGRLFTSGTVDMQRIVALTGSELTESYYIKTITGAPMSEVIRPVNIRPQAENRSVRVISGNVLSGTNVGSEGHLRYYANQLTVIPEGDYYEFMGWGMPRLGKFSVSKSYFSWLFPSKRYTLDTNINGGERAFVVNGIYEKYLPMDIYPIYLLKAILANDIDKMENLGIYEVIEEDIALCEFVDPSKTEMQAILRGGLENMIKELN